VRLANEAKEKAERVGRAIAKNYPRLAKELIKLLEDERDALQAIAKAEQEILAAGEEGTGILPIDPPQKFYAQSNGFIPAMPLCRVITLPRHDGSLPEYGSPPLWRGDVDAVGVKGI
jgi:NADPH-dependent glutamate synthase beta subunit-like oxidoreductase